MSSPIAKGSFQPCVLEHAELLVFIMASCFLAVTGQLIVLLRTGSLNHAPAALTYTTFPSPTLVATYSVGPSFAFWRPLESPELLDPCLHPRLADDFSLPLKYLNLCPPSMNNSLTLPAHRPTTSQ
jgi:hypothetical protein